LRKTSEILISPGRMLLIPPGKQLWERWPLPLVPRSLFYKAEHGQSTQTQCMIALCEHGRDAFARYRPVPDSPEDEGDSYREAGANGWNSHRPVEDADLQEELANGRTGGAEEEEKLPRSRTVAVAAQELLVKRPHAPLPCVRHETDVKPCHAPATPLHKRRVSY
jgi:hypothetical protein